ncbi:hypothetical protein SBP18_05670 [Rhodoferax ferrireducens]|uniref:hypothetical protein n=1 Tax=Rhodoferax ferrireducens TaxID=192843 RepID=UPI00298E4029|nr:hypothetical protein [Rhodoferax ferrireducens]WPC68001.1 hypothetical protein SBP18_05670 [Rhodoferax ferrireducens]
MFAIVFAKRICKWQQSFGGIPVSESCWSIPEVDFEQIGSTLPTVGLQMPKSGLEKAVPKADSRLSVPSLNAAAGLGPNWPPALWANGFLMVAVAFSSKSDPSFLPYFFSVFESPFANQTGPQIVKCS